MKYIITLRKIIEKVVIVDAASLEEADCKLEAGDITASFERTVSPDVYGGWEYEEHFCNGINQNCIPVPSDETIICSLEDFAKWYGCESVSRLEKALFDRTDCGMCYSANKDGITLVGYVEGADCEHPNETLRYPFTSSKAKEVIAALEQKASEMWHEWND